ncbi:MAG: tetratricopeptide repeat protein, partial [Planctomycetes bacterium]|nr:tetratricopeptide repeat protein [Planctomycetota bacterium]
MLLEQDMASRASPRSASLFTLCLMFAAIGLAGLGFARERAAPPQKIPVRAPVPEEDALLAAGDEAWRARRFAEAREHCERLLASFPDTPHVAFAHYFAGSAALALGDERAARVHFDAALAAESFPHAAECRLGLGKLALAAEDFAVAAAQCEQASALAVSAATRAEACFELGRALFQLGSFRRGREALAQCVTTSEWGPRAEYLLRLPSYFTVEVGEFCDEDPARACLKRLEECGLAGEIRTPEATGIPLYGVCSGRFRTREEVVA